MLKTMKSKVVAVAAAFVLVSGASVAFGASDAGAKLKEWYDAQFGQATVNMEADATAYIDGQKDGLEAEFETLKDNSAKKINDTAVMKTRVASSGIAKDLKGHLGAIGTEKDKIERLMNNQFDRFKDEAETEIFNAGTALSVKASNEMEIYTVEVGNEALESVETDIKNVTNAALDQLGQAIEDAKSDLQSQLDALESATSEDIIGLIDTRIGEVRIWVTMMTNFAVQEQEELITAKATELENAAKQAMQDLVDGI